MPSHGSGHLLHLSLPANSLLDSTSASSVSIHFFYFFFFCLNGLLLSPPAGFVDTQSILDTFTPPPLVPIPLRRAVKLPQLWAVERKWRGTLNILQPLALLGLDSFNTLKLYTSQRQDAAELCYDSNYTLNTVMGRLREVKGKATRNLCKKTKQKKSCILSLVQHTFCVGTSKTTESYGFVYKRLPPGMHVYEILLSPGYILFFMRTLFYVHS